jgi:hypothetical protein
VHETRQYLQDAIRLLNDKPTAREFYDQMTGRRSRPRSDLHRKDIIMTGPISRNRLGKKRCGDQEPRPVPPKKDFKTRTARDSRS